MCKYFSFLALAVGLMLSGTPAQSYVIIPENCRSDADKCLKAGNMDFIFIFGEIQYTDEKFFLNLDEMWPTDKKIPIVWVESGGGHIIAAKGIGRVIRKRKGIVATGNPITKVDKYYCASACVLIAAGAVERHMREIGLHSSYIIEHKNKKNENIKPDTPTGVASIKSYFDEMGINSVITDIMFNTPPEKMEELVYDENSDGDQQIVKLGFHMPLSENFPDQGFPKTKEHRDTYDDEMMEFAALNGDVWAAVALADYYTKETAIRLPSPTLERRWLQFAVDQGNVHAMHNMAVALSSTKWGKRNNKAAVQFYKKASDLSFGPSQNNLGWYYYVGKGVKKNIPRAVQLITSSALQAEPFAYGSLCEMYGHGDVFPRDNVTAYMWCDIALHQMPKGSGLKASVAAMTKISKDMTTAEITKARQRSSEWRPLKYPESVMKGDED